MYRDEKDMITQGIWDKFLTLDGEELLVVKRRHAFVIFPPIFFITFVTCFLIICSAVFFTSIVPSLALFFTIVLLFMSIFLTFVTKCVMDWYFHLYILTTQKVLEVWYAPLYSHVMNDVLLDQVNCTQVDFRRNGFLNELLDIGDIVLTFDRPTHQEEFILKDVKQCYKLGVFLTRKLLDRSSQNRNRIEPIWFKSHSRNVGAPSGK